MPLYYVVECNIYKIYAILFILYVNILEFIKMCITFMICQYGNVRRCGRVVNKIKLKNNLLKSFILQVREMLWLAAVELTPIGD